jgi:hypothetical protein
MARLSIRDRRIAAVAVAIPWVSDRPICCRSRSAAECGADLDALGQGHAFAASDPLAVLFRWGTGNSIASRTKAMKALRPAGTLRRLG